MFESIDQIPWERIEHAYGTCEDVPQMMRDLAEGNEGAKRTLGWLDNCCFHQETHYDANAWVLPYLLEIAADPKSRFRREVFNVLFSWIEGSDGLKPPASVQQRQKAASELFAGWKYRLIDSEGHWRELKSRTLEVAWRERNLLIRLLNSDLDPQVRATCSTLLSGLMYFAQHCGGSFVDDLPCEWYREDAAAELINSIDNAARQDPDAAVRVTARFSLGVMRDNFLAVQRLSDLFRDSRSPSDRIAAAFASLVTPTPLSEEAVEEIIEGFLGDFSRQATILDSPWFDDRHHSDSPDAAEQAVQKVLLSWVNASVHPLSPLIANLLKVSKESDQKLSRRSAQILSSMAQIDDVVPVLESLLNVRDTLIPAIVAAGLWRRAEVVDGRPFFTHFQRALESSDVSERGEALKSLIALQMDLSQNYEKRAEQRQPDEPEATIDGLPAKIVYLPFPFATRSLFGLAKRETDRENRKQFCDLFWRSNYAAQGEESRSYLPDPKELRNLLVEWMQDGDLVSAASDACPALSPHQQRSVAILWLKMIRDGHPNRCRIVNRLGRLKSVSVVDEIVDFIRHDTDPAFKHAAMSSLRFQAEAHRALPVILFALSSGDGELVRYAVWHFSADQQNLDDVSAAETLLQLFQEDAGNPQKRQLRIQLPEALAAMKVCRDEIALALINAACHDADEGIRYQAANHFAQSFADQTGIVTAAEQILAAGDYQALNGFLSAFSHGTKLPGELEDWVESLFSHPHHSIRAMAVRLLQWCPAPVNRQKSVAALLRDAHTDVRSYAIWWTFPDIPRTEYIPAILDMLKPPDPLWYAFSVLARSGTVDDVLEGARRSIPTGTAELLENVCEWIIAHNEAGATLEPLLIDRLNDLRLSPVSRLHLLRAWFAVNPSKRDVIINHLGRLENHPNLAVREQAVKFHSECDEASPSNAGEPPAPIEADNQ